MFVVFGPPHKLHYMLKKISNVHPQAFRWLHFQTCAKFGQVSKSKIACAAGIKTALKWSPDSSGLKIRDLHLKSRYFELNLEAIADGKSDFIEFKIS